MTTEPPPVPAPAPVPPPAGERQDAPAEPPPEYRSKFAVVTGIGALVLAVVLLWKPIFTAWRIGKDDWLGDEGATALAASVAVPLTVFGGVLVAVGAWMAAVEWRGRFKAHEVRERGLADKLPAIIEAAGKLRGAALVLIAGALLMLGAAWIGQSSADGGAGTTTTPTTTTGG